MKILKFLILSVALITGCTNQTSSNVPQDDNQSSENQIDVSKLISSDGVLSFGPDAPSFIFDPTLSNPVVSMVLTLKNLSNATISNLVIEGPTVNGFSIKLNRCGSTLKSGASCNITIDFSSRGLIDAGYTEAIIISSGSSSIHANLVGHVNFRPDPTQGLPSLKVSLDKPFFPVTASASRNLVIKNEGVGNANNLAVQIPPGYVISVNRCPTVLKPNASCQMQVFYQGYRSGVTVVDSIISVKSDGVSPVALTLKDGLAATLSSGLQLIPENGLSGVYTNFYKRYQVKDADGNPVYEITKVEINGVEPEGQFDGDSGGTVYSDQNGIGVVVYPAEWENNSITLMTSGFTGPVVVKVYTSSGDPAVLSFTPRIFPTMTIVSLNASVNSFSSGADLARIDAIGLTDEDAKNISLYSSSSGSAEFYLPFVHKVGNNYMVAVNTGGNFGAILYNDNTYPTNKNIQISAPGQNFPDISFNFLPSSYLQSGTSYTIMEGTPSCQVEIPDDPRNVGKGLSLAGNKVIYTPLNSGPGTRQEAFYLGYTCSDSGSSSTMSFPIQGH